MSRVRARLRPYWLMLLCVSLGIALADWFGQVPFWLWAASVAVMFGFWLSRWADRRELRRLLKLEAEIERRCREREAGQ